MNNLKTLKDIMFDFKVAEFFINHKLSPTIASDICAKIQLFQKQEAIKYIKIFQKIKKVDILRIPILTYGDQYVNIEIDERTAKFIEHFFNITEEDLK